MGKYTENFLNLTQMYLKFVAHVAKHEVHFKKMP